MRRRKSLLLSCLLLVGSAIAAQAQVQGTGTPGQVPVWTGDGTTLGDSVITQSPDNKIGIGTTAPLQMLHLSGDDARLRLESSRPDEWTVTEYATDGREWHTGVGGSMVTNDVQGKYYILDATAGVFRMVIGTEGHVGIGTTDTGQYFQLSVNGGNSASGVLAQSNVVNGSALYALGHGGAIGIYAKSEDWFAGYFDGPVALPFLSPAGSTSLCRNSVGAIATCSSSLRYKTDVRPFSAGLDIVNRLRPIAFTWKQGGLADIGLAAEDVERVEPLLTFRNDHGEIEGVKYNQLSAVFVNAIAEQQAQIERQRTQLAHQETLLQGLRTIVCADHPQAEVCQ